MIPETSKATQTLTPDLSAYLESIKSDLKSELNCIGVGKVQSFDATEQTVVVSLNYLRTILNTAASDDQSNYFTQNSNIAYPQLVKCPLLINSGGVGYLTFPIATGDECVIFFNDRDIDNWWTTGSQNSPPNSARLHDLNDALVFVGIRSLAKKLVSYNLNGVELGYGTTKVALEDKVRIIANMVTLRQSLDALCDALLAFVDSAGDVLSPGTAAAITSAKVLIDEVLK